VVGPQASAADPRPRAAEELVEIVQSLCLSK
jgi:hypothetical protein